MKKFLWIVLISMLALVLMAFTPLAQTEPGELPSGLIVILSSVLIPIVIQLLKWIAAWFGVVWTEKPLMIICFVLGAGVAFIWLKPVFPAFPIIDGDPATFVGQALDWIGAALSVIGTVFGLATLIYRFVLQAIFNALGVGNEKIKSVAG